MNKKSIKYIEKRKQIIKSAATVFAQKGFYNTLISDISKLAGIGKGTLYEYFSSKEELFFAVFEWVNEEMKAAATVSISALGETAAGRLRIFTDAIVGAFDEIRDLYTLTFEFWSAAAASSMQERFQSAFREMYDDYRQMVAGIIADGIRTGEFKSTADPEAIAAALVGTWDALGLQAWLAPDFDIKDTSRKFLEIIIGGLQR